MRPDDLRGALAEVGFVSIRCEDRTLEIRLSGGMDELIEGWGAGPMRGKLLALDPQQAQEFRECVALKVQQFTRENLLITPSVARVTVATAPTRA